MIYQRAPSWLSLEEDAAPTRPTEILDRAATVMRTKSAKAVPAPGEEQPAQELMILLHMGPFLIEQGEISTADELRGFAGRLRDRTQTTQQKQQK